MKTTSMTRLAKMYLKGAMACICATGFEQARRWGQEEGRGRHSGASVGLNGGLSGVEEMIGEGQRG